ncbi:MAG: M56 family metallopeptidase [bacterium]
MENFVHYILESSLAMGLFYLAYYFFLRNETFFKINRAYLLITLLSSFVLPLIRLPQIKFLSSSKPIEIYLSNLVVTTTNSSAVSTKFGISDWLVIVYLCFVGILILRLILSFYYIRKLKLNSNIYIDKDCTIAYTNTEISPFSFLNTIFIGNKNLDKDDFERIIIHEMVHISQLHTFDVLLSEILIAIFWFNPIVWLYKKSILEVHEYLADKEVYSNDSDARAYQSLLLSESFGGFKINISNNFFNSLLKRRIKMMTTSNSRKSAYYKYIVTLPAVLLFFCISGVVQFTDAKASGYSDAMIETNQDKKIVKVSETGPTLDIAKLAKAIVYPEKAKKAGKSGQVTLNVKVSKGGKPLSISVVKSSDKIFEKPAITAMGKMTFTPGRKDNKICESNVTIPINFKLK